MKPEELHFRMYNIMVCAAADAIDAIDAGHFARARGLLVTALNKAEDLYIEDMDMKLFPGSPPLTETDRHVLHELREEMALEFRQKNSSP